MAELDQIDTKILRLLQENADIPNADLAGKIGLSPSALVGRPLTAVINLEFHRHGNQYRRDFIRKTRQLAAVRQCYLVTGEVTGVLILHMEDMAEYTALCDTLFDADENVVWYRTYIVTETLKHDHGVAF